MATSKSDIFRTISAKLVVKEKAAARKFGRSVNSVAEAIYSDFFKKDEKYRAKLILAQPEKGQGRNPA